MKDGASISVELLQVFVLASSRLALHRLKVDVVVDKAFKADVLTTEPWQFTQLPHHNDDSTCLLCVHDVNSHQNNNDSLALQNYYALSLELGRQRLVWPLQLAEKCVYVTGKAYLR